MKAQEIVRLLGLKPHPEGGHYCETWRAATKPGERAAGTAIYYLLAAGEVSRWHRVDADEIWHWYGGNPLRLTMSAEGRQTTSETLGPALAEGERPQIVVPKSHWQMAEPLGAWTLVGCTVSPGFVFEGFELAPAAFLRSPGL
jgi:predicted cupin superfamily sugar epimerase